MGILKFHFDPFEMFLKLPELHRALADHWVESQAAQEAWELERAGSGAIHLAGCSRSQGAWDTRLTSGLPGRLLRSKGAMDLGTIFQLKIKKFLQNWGNFKFAESEFLSENHSNGKFPSNSTCMNFFQLNVLYRYRGPVCLQPH